MISHIDRNTRIITLKYNEEYSEKFPFEIFAEYPDGEEELLEAFKNANDAFCMAREIAETNVVPLVIYPEIFFELQVIDEDANYIEEENEQD